MDTPRNHVIDRREHEDETIVLGLLDAVDNNSSVTQRRLAHDLGIALGLANTYLKRLARKGLLKVTEAPARRYAYYLTPQGFAEKSRLTARYLAVSFDFMRRARAEVGEIFSAGVQRGESRFLLLGRGDLADVALLVAPGEQAQVVAILPPETDMHALAAAGAAFEFDRAIVTSTERPQEVFDAAVASWGAGRVFAPKLLRVRQPPTGGRDG